MIDGQGDRSARAEEPFDEPLQDDPQRAVEEAEPYFPPTDPVMDAREPDEIRGGFEATSMSGDAEVAPRSVSGGVADETIASRVRRELREDAATTHLDLEVEAAEGVVTLRGKVDDLADVDNALEVAGRVAGVVEVIDETEEREPA